MSSKKFITPQVLKGFRDVDSFEIIARNKILSEARQVAALANFQEITTPYLEYVETLLGEGGETDKQVYRFTDHGGREIALRYDLTVPFARYMAENNGKIRLPFKKLQIGTVFRGEKPQKGRYREFMQCDLDIIGDDSWLSEYEVIIALNEILQNLKTPHFKMLIGNRSVLTSLIANFIPNISVEDLQFVLIGIDKLEKIGPAGVLQYLSTKISASSQDCEKLLSYITNPQSNNLDSLAKLIPSQQQELTHLNTLVSHLKKQGCNVSFDLTIARGLAYYTGTVFETVLVDTPELGSICSGGRYANLTARFGVEGLSGFGGSLGVDRLLCALDHKVLSDKNEKKIYFAVLDSLFYDYALNLMQQIRHKGICCDINLSISKLSKLMQVADKSGYDFVVIVGENEVNNHKINLKNLKTGESKILDDITGLVSIL